MRWVWSVLNCIFRPRAPKKVASEAAYLSYGAVVVIVIIVVVVIVDGGGTNSHKSKQLSFSQCGHITWP